MGLSLTSGEGWGALPTGRSVRKRKGKRDSLARRVAWRGCCPFPSRHPHCEVTPERPVEVGRVPNRGEVEGTSLRICTALKKCLGPLPKMGTGVMVGGVAGRRA